VIPKEELENNAVDFIRALNGQGIINLGAIVIFFDMKHGHPVIAGNVPREKMQVVLKEVLKAMPGLEVRSEQVPESKRIITLDDVKKGN
jgi:hypothetical protein